MRDYHEIADIIEEYLSVVENKRYDKKASIIRQCFWNWKEKELGPNVPLDKTLYLADEFNLFSKFDIEDLNHAGGWIRCFIELLRTKPTEQNNFTH